MECPHVDALRAFATDRLPPDQHALVETHVNDCESCREIADLSHAPTDFRELLLGQGYDIDSELGRGATAITYKAREIGLRRWVAVKVFKEKDMDRAGREGGAQAKVRSQHVIQIHREAFAVGGYPVLVMELADTSLIRTAPEDFAQALDWAAQAATGLADIHAEGVVHGDISPANLYIIRETEAASATIKIGDFGHAIRDGERPRFGGGTPGHRAPELDQTGPSRQTDVYALGKVIHGLLAGLRPCPQSPKSVARIIQRCLEERCPDLRPTAVGLSRELRKAGGLLRDAEARQRARRLPNFLILVLTPVLCLLLYWQFARPAAQPQPMVTAPWSQSPITTPWVLESDVESMRRVFCELGNRMDLLPLEDRMRLEEVADVLDAAHCKMSTPIDEDIGKPRFTADGRYVVFSRDDKVSPSKVYRTEDCSEAGHEEPLGSMASGRSVDNVDGPAWKDDHGMVRCSFNQRRCVLDDGPGTMRGHVIVNSIVSVARFADRRWLAVHSPGIVRIWNLGWMYPLRKNRLPWNRENEGSVDQRRNPQSLVAISPNHKLAVLARAQLVCLYALDPPEPKDCQSLSKFLSTDKEIRSVSVTDTRLALIAGGWLFRYRIEGQRMIAEDGSPESGRYSGALLTEQGELIVAQDGTVYPFSTPGDKRCDRRGPDAHLIKDGAKIYTAQVNRRSANLGLCGAHDQTRAYMMATDEDVKDVLVAGDKVLLVGQRTIVPCHLDGRCKTPPETRGSSSSSYSWPLSGEERIQHAALFGEVVSVAIERGQVILLGLSEDLELHALRWVPGRADLMLKPARAAQVLGTPGQDGWKMIVFRGSIGGEGWLYEAPTRQKINTALPHTCQGH